MQNEINNNGHAVGEKEGDQNLMKVNELLNKHAEANRKIGFMAKNNSREIRMDAQSILYRAPKLIINNIDSVN